MGMSPIFQSVASCIVLFSEDACMSCVFCMKTLVFLSPGYRCGKGGNPLLYDDFVVCPWGSVSLLCVVASLLVGYRPGKMGKPQSLSVVCAQSQGL